MSAIKIFTSESAHGEFRQHVTWNAPGLAHKLGAWSFAFFLLKGLAWLLLPLMAMYFA